MQQRSTGVTVIAILFFLTGIALVLSGIGILAVPIPTIDPLTQALVNYVIGIGLAVVVMGAAEFAIGWGLWSLKNWARITAIVLFALGAVSNLVIGIGFLVGVNVWGVPVRYPGVGVASLLIAAIQGFVIWYLTKPDVVQQFDSSVYAVMSPTPFPTVAPPPPPPQPSPAPRSVQPPRSPDPTQLISSGPPPAGWLVARNGPHQGKSFGLKRGITNIGRDTKKADIILDTTTASVEHARVRYEHGQFFLYDMASTNGTFINNRQIQKQMLRDGDVVRFGEAEFVFKSVS